MPASDSPSPAGNAELLAVLAGLARDRVGGRRGVGKAETAVLRMVFSSELLIPVDADGQALRFPSLLPRLGDPGRVVVLFTDGEAAQAWLDARKSEGPFCGGLLPAGEVIGAERPDPKRWRRWLIAGRINGLSVNPAGPLCLSASAIEFDVAASRLANRSAALPEADPAGAWLEVPARTEMRVRTRELLARLARETPAEDTAAELREEFEAITSFGSRLYQCQLALLPGRGTVNASFSASLGAALAGDPCLAVDGLLKTGELITSALAEARLEAPARTELRKRLSTVASEAAKLVGLGYRTGDIERLGPG